MMHVVETDLVAFGGAVGIAPAPTGRDAGVEEIGDLVVGDDVVRTGADPDPAGVHIDPSAVTDDIVVHRDMIGAGRLLHACPLLPDADAAGAEIVQIAAFEAAFLAALAEPHGVLGYVADLTILEHSIPRPVQHDGRIDGKRGLERGIAGRRQQTLLVLERQAFECDAFHELAGLGVALDEHELRQQRRHDLGPCHILARQGPIEESAIATEEPLARLVESGSEILQVKARADGPTGVVGQFLPRGDDLTRVEFYRRQIPPRDAPVVIGDQHDIVKLRFAYALQRSDGLGGNAGRTQELPGAPRSALPR